MAGRRLPSTATGADRPTTAIRGALWVGFAGAALSACGGAAPLLHPAHLVPVNEVSAGAGIAGQFVPGALESTINRGRAAASESLADSATAQRYARGVLGRALIAPGAAPWVSARVGVSEELEAGLTYFGRSVRLDGRYALALSPAWAMSFGAGASALMYSPDSASPGPDALTTPGDAAEFALDARGWGADLPLIVGYQSTGAFFEAWGGVRTGFEAAWGSLRSRAADPASPRWDASGRRFWASGLGGFALGVPPVWLRVELGVTHHWVSGELSPPAGEESTTPVDVSLSAWSFAPSAALVGKF